MTNAWAQRHSMFLEERIALVARIAVRQGTCASVGNLLRLLKNHEPCSSLLDTRLLPDNSLLPCG